VLTELVFQQLAVLRAVFGERLHQSLGVVAIQIVHLVDQGRKVAQVKGQTSL
jgi:hypothetical protein